MLPNDQISGMMSPGGFAFGVQGWHWGEPLPRSITFFLDGTARVSDQWGRPIRGAVVDQKEVFFASAPASDTDKPGERKKLATHAQVIKALENERIDWRKLAIAGWPQLPYAMLKEIDNLPLTPFEELRKIPDQQLRKDALKMRREMEEMVAKQLTPDDDE